MSENTIELFTDIVKKEGIGHQERDVWWMLFFMWNFQGSLGPSCVFR